MSPHSSPAPADDFARAASRVLGWVYFACWSVSFYPQLLINCRRKSVTGLAFDYFTVNILGFACYTVSAALFLFSPVVRDQYARRHPASPEPTTRWNDLAFAAHAMLISTITWSQFYFWGYERHPSQRLSRTMIAVILGCTIAIIVHMVLVGAHVSQWIDVVYTLQYVKLFISIVKYTPQAYLNYKRKSTVGWSIQNILLDISGGILSLAQLVLDSSLQSDWSGLTGNPIKFFLSQIAILFDIVFILQHYVFYRHARETKLSGDDATPSPGARHHRNLGEEEQERFGRRRYSGYRADDDDEEEALFEHMREPRESSKNYGTGDARHERETQGLLGDAYRETDRSGADEAFGRSA